MSKFTPTDEQRAVIDLAGEGTNIAIQAGAGTGKTSTLILVAEAMPTKRIQYVAFNKAIVTEAGGKFPDNVNCSTAHALAYRAIVAGNRTLQRRLQSSERMPSWDQAKIMGLPKGGTQVGDKHLRDSQLAGIVNRAVTKFCQSGDPEITERHFPYIDGIDEPDEFGQRTYRNNNAARAYLLPFARRTWADLTSESGRLPFKHEHYLKMWQLSGPTIPADVILFDEAQDANPVMVAIVAAQTHAQIIWVGDSQQQIYSFTGAINALDNVPRDRQAFLTQSFRFGPAIAEHANTILDELNADLRLKGTPTIESTVGMIDSPNAFLTRTNAAAIMQVLSAQQAGTKVHLVGDGKEFLAFARAAEKLMAGKRVEHPDLACFDSWAAVLEYVQTDEQGEELRLNVKLVTEFGTAVIIAALSGTVRESDADLIVSTAHKSKGREWSKVTLGPDFPPREKAHDEERRLLYVACTRAMHALDVTRVPYFNPAEGVA
jgi:superfamily I DNA/RNA helicase